MPSMTSTADSSAVYSPADSLRALPLNAPLWAGNAWPVFWATAKSWTWSLVTKFPLSVAYFAFVSQGLRSILPDLGVKLSKLPGLVFLADYRLTYRLDIANLLTVIPLIAVWILWHLGLEIYLAPASFERRFSRWDIDRCKSLILTMGVIVIVADACLFYKSFISATWGSSQAISIAALLVTTTYVVLLAFVTFVSLYLRQQISDLTKED